MCESLQKFGSATRYELSPPVHDEVVVESLGGAAFGIDRQRHARIAGDVGELAAVTEMPDNDVIPVDTDLHRAHLWAAVGIDGHQVAESPGR